MGPPPTKEAEDPQVRVVLGGCCWLGVVGWVLMEGVDGGSVVGVLMGSWCIVLGVCVWCVVCYLFHLH
jgi:hypothetical protein